MSGVCVLKYHGGILIPKDGQTTPGCSVVLVSPNLNTIRAPMANGCDHFPKDLRLVFFKGYNNCAHDYSLVASAFIADTAPIKAREVPSSK